MASWIDGDGGHDDDGYELGHSGSWSRGLRGELRRTNLKERQRRNSWRRLGRNDGSRGQPGLECVLSETVDCADGCGTTAVSYTMACVDGRWSSDNPEPAATVIDCCAESGLCWTLPGTSWISVTTHTCDYPSTLNTVCRDVLFFNEQTGGGIRSLDILLVLVVEEQVFTTQLHHATHCHSCLFPTIASRRCNSQVRSQAASFSRPESV
jgi:hypothetical protein